MKPGMGQGRGLEILDIDGMRRADALAMQRGTAGIALMEKAGEAVAAAAGDMLRPGERVLVLAGPGNNGGDGWVAARLLRQRGWPVRLVAMKPAQRLKGDAALAAARWQGPVELLADFVAAGKAGLDGIGLIVDALFGAGLDRPLAGHAATLAGWLNEARAAGRLQVLAVDVPSGLHGDTGTSPGHGPVIAADVTVTFFRRKPAHLLLPGREACGRVQVADIGIPENVLDDIAPVAWCNDPALWCHLLPPLAADAHKYARGSLVVLSGDALHTGASRLAALAGLHAGAGVVSLAGERQALLVHAAHLTEIMLDEAADAAAFVEVLRRKRAHAAVIGPAAGVTQRTREMVLAALLHTPDVALVLDADVFGVFAEAPQELFAAIAERSAPVVLTPHEGEFARLFPDLAATAGTAPAGKLARARAAARRAGCVLLLKGGDTVVADGGNGQDAAVTTVIEAHGPPWLATAGSGDVLAGVIGALLAGGMAAMPAAAAAAWLHAEAARRLDAALLAGDLPPLIGRLKARLTATAPPAGQWRCS